MQIFWTLNASQINNIENLNWDFNISWNTFSLYIEIEKRKTEILDWINTIESQLKQEWKINENIVSSWKELKNDVNNSSSTILESYKKYAKYLKEATETSSSLWKTFQELLKIWWSIWTLITLLIK
jgi:hypothetical protein